MTGISRRDLLKGAVVSAASVSTLGLLAACSNEAQPAATASEEGTNTTDAGAASTDSNSEYVAEVLDPSSAPDAASASNFNVVPESETVVGDHVREPADRHRGRDGAPPRSTKRTPRLPSRRASTCSPACSQCTADAEKIHIELEYNLAKEIDPATEKPEPPAVEEHESDINLISGANGEIYETSDMYPSFIKKAQEEGNNKAVQVFTRAKLAEAYHAKLYMDAYTTIDEPFDGKYYLCPICGYIHKGENFVACPICLAPKSSFTAY